MQSESQKKTTILLVEDHEIIRKGLCTLINEYAEWTVCGEACDGKDAIEKTLTLHPDVVLMDIVMPVMNGIDATKEIGRLSPGTKVVMISMYESQKTPSIIAGAHAYVDKSRTWADLRDAIAAVLEPGFIAQEP